MLCQLILTMVASCVAFGCTARKGKDPSVSFHRFPHKNPELLKKWVHAIRRENWTPTQHSWICSQHFKETCFVVRPGKKGRRLYDHAIPTEFPAFPKHLQKQYTKRKSPKKRKLEQAQTCAPSPSKVARFITADHSYSGPETSATDRITSLTKQVKALQEKVCQRDKQIKKHEAIVTVT